MTGSLEVLDKVITALCKSEQFLVAKSGYHLCMNYLIAKYTLQFLI